jgi:hypothetical protein
MRNITETLLSRYSATKLQIGGVIITIIITLLSIYAGHLIRHPAAASIAGIALIMFIFGNDLRLAINAPLPLLCVPLAGFTVANITAVDALVICIIGFAILFYTATTLWCRHITLLKAE